MTRVMAMAMAMAYDDKYCIKTAFGVDMDPMDILHSDCLNIRSTNFLY